MKHCNKCGTEHPLDQFRVVISRKPYGTYKYRRNQCNACVKIANKKYYDANRRKCIDAVLKWARDNPERRKAYQDQYRKDNHEYYLRKYTERYWADPDRFREEQRKRGLRSRGGMRRVGAVREPPLRPNPSVCASGWTLGEGV